MSDPKDHQNLLTRGFLRLLTAEVLVLIGWSLSGCAAPAEDIEVELVEVPNDTPREIVEIRILPPTVASHLRQRDELTGLILIRLEAGLFDLHYVTASVDNSFPSQAAEQRLFTDAQRWTAELSIESTEVEMLTLYWRICPESELPVALQVAQGLGPEANPCYEASATGPREATWKLTAQLLEQTEQFLDRYATTDARADWSRSESLDGYAALVAGRSAAVFYGLRPPVEVDGLGDNRRDPVARAVFLDPTMPHAWWIVGRRAAAAAEMRAAREAFTRAHLARPSGLWWSVEEAFALGEAGRWEEAWSAWKAINKRSPEDPRFVVPRARAALKAGFPAEGSLILDHLPEQNQEERQVAELRVAIAENTGFGADYDLLLFRWQNAAPKDPEPVRRRIALRSRGHQWQEALLLIDELAARGQSDEANRWAMSLAIGIGDLEQAAERARAAGLDTVADQIVERAAVERDPKVISPVTVEQDPWRAVLYASALVDSAPDQALAMATAVAEREPGWPEPWAVIARAEQARGNTSAAARAEQRLQELDPLWD